MNISDKNDVSYVIYCRKSTDEEGKQDQSITDQIKSCINFLEQHKEFEIVPRPKEKTYDDIFHFDAELDREQEAMPMFAEYHDKARKLFLVIERDSAYKPNQRPKRKKLMSLAKQGKINGIFSYAPDRHARNMLEAGELLDQIDQYHVDVQYVTHAFHNNASGKMMLTMLFGFAKHYSDNRSDLTVRGTTTRLSSGKAMGAGKYGYIINDEGYFEPDGKNFDLMQAAFYAKLYQHKTDAEIGKYLSENGFTIKDRIGKNNKLYGKQKYKESKLTNYKNLGKQRRDPFFYGMFVYGKKYEPSNQIEQNAYYKPVITKEEFDDLQKTLGRSRSKTVPNKSKKENMLIKPFPSSMIIHPSGRRLQFSVPVKKRYKDKLYDLQKTNPKAELSDVILPHQMHFERRGEKNFSINCEKLIERVKEKLKHFKVDKSTMKGIKKIAKERMRTISTKTDDNIKAKQMRLAKVQRTYDTFIENTLEHVGSYDREQNQIYTNKKNELESLIDAIKTDIDQKDIYKRELQYEAVKFIELLHNTYEIYEASDYVRKRLIAEKLFSNIIVSDENTVEIRVIDILETIFSTMVTDTGFEPVTSTMSMWRSRQLS